MKLTLNLFWIQSFLAISLEDTILDLQQTSELISIRQMWHMSQKVL